jgi:hypothetical protein
MNKEVNLYIFLVLNARLRLLISLGILSFNVPFANASEIAKDMPFKQDLGYISYGVYDPNITYWDSYITFVLDRNISGSIKAGVNQARADLSK